MTVAVLMVTQICVDQLTDNELITMNLCAQLGTDPRPCMGYGKAAALFTDYNLDGVPIVHEEVKRAMALMTRKRIG